VSNSRAELGRKRRRRAGRRWQLGRLAAYLEPRDVWVGVYVAEQAVYVCPLPCVVVRWSR